MNVAPVWDDNVISYRDALRAQVEDLSEIEERILGLALGLRHAREATELRIYAQDAAVDPEVAKAIEETEQALAAGDLSHLADADTVRKEMLKAFEAAH